MCWSSTNWTSSSSDCKLTCSCHDIADNCWVGIKQLSLTHSNRGYWRIKVTGILIQMSTFLLISLIYTSAGGILVPEWIILPVVGIFMSCKIYVWLKWMVPRSCIYLSNKGSVPSGIYDINGNWLSCLGHFALKDLLFGLPIFWLWVNLIKLIPESHRDNFITYLSFYLFPIHDIITYIFQ